ncbi:hypothetical protein AB7W56_10295 [Providencia rettgeri]
MSYIHVERDFSNWNKYTSGTGNIQITEDGRIRLQNSDSQSRALLQRNIMLMAGDEVTVYAVGKTTSLTAGALVVAIEQPSTVRKDLVQFDHNEDSILNKVSWKLPAEFSATAVTLTVGLPSGTEAIAYLTDLYFEIKSENLGSRRVLMDGVVKITNGIAELESNYEHRNVGSVTTASINLDIKPINIVALDRLPHVQITSIFNTDDKPVSNAILQPVASFTKAGVLNIRLQNPLTGNAVGVTGDAINKTISFSVFI